MIQVLAKYIDGEVYDSNVYRRLFSTDASPYLELPLGVVFPKHKDDIKEVINFAGKNKIPLIFRGAGTSLAGQVVGKGLIVDTSKYMTEILEVNTDEQWVRVQPGVVRDKLNQYLKPLGFQFGPETSTSNRCTIGGMVGNNSCGAHALVYKTTRDHTLSVNAILADGSEVVFGHLSEAEFDEKMIGDDLEANIYRHIHSILGNNKNQQTIKSSYPDPTLLRRNTGYALDELLKLKPFDEDGENFNFCKLLAGSEGTLCATTEIKLDISPLPPPVNAMVCVHCNTLDEALRANIVALKHKPVAIELMDGTLLALTKDNLSQARNRYFIDGEPGAIIFVEFATDSEEETKKLLDSVEKELKDKNFGYHYPVLWGDDINRAWALRKAGLGVMGNMKGDSKPVALMEDMAVKPKYLPEFVEDVKTVLKKYDKECLFYAHADTGELHLRPIINLKDPAEVEIFAKLGREMVDVVKKYKGSLSGEHGDGRLRGSFVRDALGEECYSLLKDLKAVWDKDNLFNPNKIINTPNVKESLRYNSPETKEYETYFRWEKEPGLTRAAEKCNGSGDCRKFVEAGGTMCPTFMATGDEMQSTRARANILREYLANGRIDAEEAMEVLKPCLSCKACKSECPSSVDIAGMKAEFLQMYYDKHGVGMQTRMVGEMPRMFAFFAPIAGLYNVFAKLKPFKNLALGAMGFHAKRSLPEIKKFKHQPKSINKNSKLVYLLADEFTNLLDGDIAEKAYLLLTKLGYRVELTPKIVSGRTYLSQGLLKKAKALANTNTRKLYALLNKGDACIVSIEPSSSSVFADDNLRLVDENLLDKAEVLAERVMDVEQFIANAFETGEISVSKFKADKRIIHYHGHCHQKYRDAQKAGVKILSVPENYKVVEIKSGCCGMAGAYGYSKKNYTLSMQVAELVLLPHVRKAPDEHIICASGSSCRQQVWDGAERKVLHPVEVLLDCLRV